MEIYVQSYLKDNICHVAKFEDDVWPFPMTAGVTVVLADENIILIIKTVYKCFLDFGLRFAVFL